LKRPIAVAVGDLHQAKGAIAHGAGNVLKAVEVEVGDSQIQRRFVGIFSDPKALAESAIAIAE
jgi:hypothetical protein